LAIQQKPFPARHGLPLTQHKHQIRVIVPEFQVSIDVRLEINLEITTAIASAGLSHRITADKLALGCAGGRGGGQAADKQAGPEDLASAGKHPGSIGAVDAEDDRTIAGP
jgi:hypothetical protein